MAKQLSTRSTPTLSAERRIDSQARNANRSFRISRGGQLITVILAVIFGAIATSAHAADGCLVLLCLAAPSWSSIAQCVDPVRAVLTDLARGRPFPTCSMSGSGNTADSRMSNAPDFCPAQYTTATDLESATRYECTYYGAISVSIDGALWSRTWWSLSGDNVTEFTPAAKAALGTWDSRFDDDYAAWTRLHPVLPVPPTCLAC